MMLSSEKEYDWKNVRAEKELGSTSYRLFAMFGSEADA